MKALIIEDEILASRHLQQVLKESGEITVLATLESINETIEWFRRNSQPDIVFLDIHLADGLAFEIFNHVSITCPIIFTTAYDEYALKAFKVNSIDYLLKPVEVADIRSALKKLEEIKASSGERSALNNLIEYFNKAGKYKTHFLIPSKGDKLIPVQAADIAYFYIDAGTVKAVSFEGRTYRFDHTLDDLEGFLDPRDFMRANRQYLVSRAAIKDIDIWFNSRLSVNLKVQVPGKILVSKAKITEFKKWFEG